MLNVDEMVGALEARAGMYDYLPEMPDVTISKRHKTLALKARRYYEGFAELLSGLLEEAFDEEINASTPDWWDGEMMVSFHPVEEDTALPQILHWCDPSGGWGDRDGEEYYEDPKYGPHKLIGKSGSLT